MTADADRAARRSLAAICAIAFLTNLGYGVVLPILPGLVAGVGGGLAIGVVYGVFSAAKIGAQLVGGVAADRWGDRRLLLVSTVLYAITLGWLAFAASPAAFILARVLEGIAVGLSYPAGTAAVSRLARPGRFGRDMGLLLGIGGAGIVVGPLLGIALGRQDVRVPLLVLAAVTLLVAPLSLRIADGEARRPAPLSRDVRVVGRFLLSASFLVLVLPVAFNKVVFSVFQPLLPLHAVTLALPDWAVAGLFAATGILFALAQPVAGALTDRVSARAVTASAFAVVCVLLGAMAVFTSAPAFSLLYGAYVFAGSMLFTADMKLVGDSFGERDAHGKIFGVAHAVTDLGMTIAPIVLLPLHERSPGLLFATLAGLGLLTLGAFSLRPRALPVLPTATES